MEHFDPDKDPGFVFSIRSVNQNVTGQIADQHSKTKVLK